ncbi:secondary thiamine-phosphate synthase enzyme YjbQ [Clostridium sp.]|uniref:secondary thiamine-phosphate synthase enzyme YjbQ n=1 Tax=Clostridium sp. TaxID=1506 RepID=UPI00290AF223|nr:secondary thiamine-phosphate synthase enzyme YjbQ [Clostridium sp.]MDU5107641.1 secondary thiamine-phosphate synthase enzyme YjbQ [Clostridium sp.]
MSKVFKHSLSINDRQTMVDITHIIKEDLKASDIKEGIMVVYCPHTTAGITINENADPDVVRDMIYGFEKVYPTVDKNYKHFEGNSHSHMKATTIGASQSLIINDGKIILGRWQGIYFCEFDGPRNRDFYVKIIEG